MSKLRILKDRHATMLVEFALVGPVFVILLLSILELSIFYGKRAVIDNAVQAGARVVRVGYVAGNRSSRLDFEDAFCAAVRFVDCSEIDYSVEASASLTSDSFSPRLNSAGNLAGARFELGAPGDIVIVTAGTRHSFITPFGQSFFSENGESTLDLVSHIIVKNEPFPT